MPKCSVCKKLSDIVYVSDYTYCNNCWDTINMPLPKLEDNIVYAKLLLNYIRLGYRFEAAQKDSEFLNYLKIVGVDNWEGYSLAMDMMEGDE